MTQPTKVDFDKYAEQYDELLEQNVAFFGEGNEYFAEYKVRTTASLVSAPPKRILEYGCGTGRNLPYFREIFPEATLVGCDISEKSLEVARKVVPGATFFPLGNPAAEPPQEPFDLIFVAGVFHHVQPPQRDEVMADIVRRARPGADIVIFEHNPYNPVTRKLVSQCAYDEDAVLVPPPELIRLAEAGKLRILRRTYTLFFPAALKAIRGLEQLMGWLPLGGQYYVHARPLAG